MGKRSTEKCTLTSTGSTRLHWRSAFASMLLPPRDYDSIGHASHSAGVPIPDYAHARAFRSFGYDVYCFRQPSGKHVGSGVSQTGKQICPNGRLAQFGAIRSRYLAPMISSSRPPQPHDDSGWIIL